MRQRLFESIQKLVFVGLKGRKHIPFGRPADVQLMGSSDVRLFLIEVYSLQSSELACFQ